MFIFEFELESFLEVIPPPLQHRDEARGRLGEWGGDTLGEWRMIVKVDAILQ